MKRGRPLYKMKYSPFSKERNMKNKSKTIGVRVPEDVYDDISNYFKGVYGDNYMSKGINDILITTLNNVCTEKTLYKNISIFMMIPKNDDLDKMSDDSIIFAVIDELHDFDNYNTNIFENEDYDLPFIKGHLSEDFSTLPISFLLDVENHCFCEMNIDDLSNDNFLDELASTYEVNLDDYYWTHLKLNNYLDEYRNGQYQTPIYNNEHFGVYVLKNELILNPETPQSDISLFLTIKWRYFDEIDSIDLNPQFFEENEFISHISEAKDKELSNKFFEVLYGEDTKTYLINMKKNFEKDLSTIKSLIKSIDDKLKNDFPEE